MLLSQHTDRHAAHAHPRIVAMLFIVSLSILTSIMRTFATPLRSFYLRLSNVRVTYRYSTTPVTALGWASTQQVDGPPVQLPWASNIIALGDTTISLFDVGATSSSSSLESNDDRFSVLDGKGVTSCIETATTSSAAEDFNACAGVTDLSTITECTSIITAGTKGTASELQACTYNSA
jgi:hypothetical protein